MGDQQPSDARRVSKRKRSGPPERFVSETELRDKTTQQDSAFKQPQPAGSPEGNDADEDTHTHTAQTIPTVPTHAALAPRDQPGHVNPGPAGVAAAKSPGGTGESPTAASKPSLSLAGWLGVTEPALAKMFVEPVPSGPKRPTPNAKAGQETEDAVGKLATTGAKVLAQLQIAAGLRTRHKGEEADAVVAAAMLLRPPFKVPSADALDQRARRTGRELEAIALLRSGDGPSTARAVASMLERPAMRELMRTESWLDLIGDLEKPYLAGEQHATRAISTNVAGFLSALTLEKGGTLDKDTEAAVSAALAAVVGAPHEMKGRVLAYSRLLNVTRYRVRAAIQQRNDAMLRPGGKGRFTRQKRKPYSNKYDHSPLHDAISDWLHKVKARPNNASKRGNVKVPVSADPVTGEIKFELHPPVTVDDKHILWYELTGVNVDKPKELNPATGKLEHPMDRTPDHEWPHIRALAVKQNVEVTVALIHRTICDCMGKSSTTYVLVVPLCPCFSQPRHAPRALFYPCLDPIVHVFIKSVKFE